MNLLSSLLRALLLGVAVFAAGCASLDGAGGEPDWLLTSATETANERHFIVTVALDDPNALEEAARRLASAHAVELVAEWPLQAIAVHCFVFRAAEGRDLKALESELLQAEGVRTVQRMRQFSLLGHGYQDEFFGLQTSLVAINIPKAHRLSTGMNVRIGIIDTGIDAGHPDLVAQIEDERDFVADRAERNSVDRRGEVHGTAMAGVIAADGANGRGIVGVAPDARILALRGCWQEVDGGRCSSFSLARAINFAIVNDIDILNMSLAGPYDPLLAELIDAGLARGVIFVAAHEETADLTFPAALDGVIAAGSGEVWMRDGSRPLPAPAVDVITTAAGGGYDFFSGSSVAAAHVSGIAALLLQRDPNLTPERLQQALQRSVRTDSKVPGGFVLDSCRAIGLVQGFDIPRQC